MKRYIGIVGLALAGLVVGCQPVNPAKPSKPISVQLKVPSTKTQARMYMNKYGNTALHRASSEGHTGEVWLLIFAGAEVNSEDKDGRTALRLAADNGYKFVKFDIYEFTKGHTEIIYGVRT